MQTLLKLQMSVAVLCSTPAEELRTFTSPAATCVCPHGEGHGWAVGRATLVRAIWEGSRVLTVGRAELGWRRWWLVLGDVHWWGLMQWECQALSQAVHHFEMPELVWSVALLGRM